jgi:hypothetical protein
MAILKTRILQRILWPVLKHVFSDDNTTASILGNIPSLLWCCYITPSNGCCYWIYNANKNTQASLHVGKSRQTKINCTSSSSNTRSVCSSFVSSWRSLNSQILEARMHKQSLQSPTVRAPIKTSPICWYENRAVRYRNSRIERSKCGIAIS